MFLSGEICPVRRRGECRAVAPGRAVLTGQRSAEVVKTSGIVVAGSDRTLGIDWWSSRTVIVAMIAANLRGGADRCGGTGESGRALGCA